MYRSPSRSKDEFDLCSLNFEQLIPDRMSQNSLFMLVTGNFNGWLSSSWKDDLTASEGSQVNAITSFYGLNQFIREPGYILQNSSPCIDLIFINQSNFIMDIGVHVSLDAN